ncbi:hypothetical protein Scep_011303 [Stephania cephalantha]|uniref:Zinc finger LSD1-type domain-containing protein n=1 Tax=Stephania cephalantha TaxID=152367 RepID=A0AAP0JF10_9MAGN
MESQSISPPTAQPPLESKHGGLVGRPESQQISSSTETGQMVCGVCRCLVSYSTPARHVKCPSCQTVNYILEAHEVGNVKCGKCSILLMYQYGAPKVKCSCCDFVTEINEQNGRSLLSVQQGQPPASPKANAAH